MPHEKPQNQNAHSHKKSKNFDEMAQKFIKSRTRDRTEPILDKIGIKSGQIILDYACGPGVYSWVAAEKVGSKGFVHTADINPKAEFYVKQQMKLHGQSNFDFIQTECKIPLDDHSIDIVLLFDVYHHLTTPQDQITEFHRILKPTGNLAVLVDHLDPREVRTAIEGFGGWQFIKAEENLLVFAPQ